MEGWRESDWCRGGSAIWREGGGCEGMSWGEMGEERMSDCVKYDTNGIDAKCK